MQGRSIFLNIPTYLRIGTYMWGLCKTPTPKKQSMFIHILTLGDVHLAGVCVEPWAATLPILRVSAWKNCMGAINICMAFTHGAHGKKRPWQPWAESVQGCMVLHNDESSWFIVTRYGPSMDNICWYTQQNSGNLRKWLSIFEAI